jgi:ABC-2 type transport system permease protein
MEAIYILWLREVKRYTRSRAQIIASMGQPLLYLLVLGFGLGPVYQKAGGGSYLQFMSPGVIGMAVLFSSVFSGIALLWDRQFGFLKETLVAPVPRIEIMIGRTLGAATTAMIQGLLVTAVCLIAGFRPVSLAMVPLAFLFLALIAIVFAALGTTIGSSLQDMQAFPIVMNFLVLPIFFLSGALFPLKNLPRALGIVTSVDPLSYGVDGLRVALLGGGYFGATIDLLVLAVVAVILLCLGAWRFSKIERETMTRGLSSRAHEKVLDTAAELFSERGLDKTSVDAIAASSGVSKATIYKHWADKEALCLEVLVHVHGADEGPTDVDSGNLKADLLAFLKYEPAHDRAAIQKRLMPHLIAYSARNPEFGRAW